MNIAAAAISLRKVTYILSALVIVFGWYAYQHLGRLEMPDFVIKVAVVTTPYPGASPEVVEREVTEVIEESIQALGRIRELRSLSQEGLSIVYVEMANTLQSHELPQVWDELRRKVHDNAYKLPPGAGPSIVNDDFGDVYGLFYGITGTRPDGTPYSYEALRQYAKVLKKEILLCRDVKKVEFWGTQREVVYMYVRYSKLAELGIGLGPVLRLLESQNLIENAGKVSIGDSYVRITPSGDWTTVEEIGELMIAGRDGQTVRLRDIAEIERGYIDPPLNLMRINGEPAIGLGVSTIAGGNAVTMTQIVEARVAELIREGVQPEGMQLYTISSQGATVTRALDTFVVNLVEALIIVVVLLMIFMGWKSGLLIGVILLQTILGTFIVMWLCGITMQLISLGALVLALGMLVDNAIVVAEGVIIGVQRGKTRVEAAIETIALTQYPLLGATVIAVLAFAAIGFAPGNIGEFCRSLFWVMLISLTLSWIFAVTTTPLLCVDFLRIPKIESGDPYGHWIFRLFRRFLRLVLRYRILSLATIFAMLVVAMIGFMFIPDFFFSDSDRPQFYVDFWRPQGSHITVTDDDLAEVERYLWTLAKERPELGELKQVARFVGSGTLRFVLGYDSKDVNPSFGQLLVTVDSKDTVNRIKPVLEGYLQRRFPGAECQVIRFANGPPVTYKIEARFRGRDANVLKKLATQAQTIMREEGAWDVATDWRQMVEVKRPVINEAKSRRLGITRSDIARALHTHFVGTTVGVYREDEDLLPIVLRPEGDLRGDYSDVANIIVTSSTTGVSVPLLQVVDQVDASVFEDSLIRRFQQQKSLIARCNPPGNMLASVMLLKLMPRIESEIEIPSGYSLEWRGEYYTANEGKRPLAMAFPICLGMMFLILIIQFNQFRPPIIIFACLPLAFIGVTAGLLGTGLAFGFMSILGFLGLSGMLIKNAIILIEQIQHNRYTIKMEPYSAVLEAAVSRLRPVVMAAGTTVLGMFPLLTHPFYCAMAATIIGGLGAATALTLVVVPLFYVILYRIRSV
ncbi:MAG: efflux RND transporter permease subunit [Thermoguttaceae bacterium]